MSTITIAGNIGKDPELRYSGAGNAFMTLPVAVEDEAVKAVQRGFADGTEPF